MATFRCGKCGCNDDTALCNYWSARVRNILPVCSACDPEIGKWHGQFPRIFGVFLMTPIPTRSPREVLASLVERLRLAEKSSHQARKAIAAPGGTFDFNDPIPSYKPLMASPMCQPYGPSIAERGSPVTAGGRS